MELEAVAVHKALGGVVGRKAAVVGNLEEVAGIGFADHGEGIVVDLEGPDRDTVDFAAVQIGLVGDSRTAAVDAAQVEVGSSPGPVVAVLGSFAVEARRLVANREVVVKSS